MTRSQRRLHLYVWIVLAPAALLLLLAAVMARRVEPQRADRLATPAIRGAG